MADIVNNLFGIDPAALQQQRAATDFANAFRFAQLDPLQRANLSIYQGSAGLGRAANQLLGGDEQLNRATQVRQLASQFDMTNPEGIDQFAKAVAPFAPDVAQVAVQRANQLRTSASQLRTGELTREKTQMDIASAERKIAQDEKLREALAALPANATEEQYLAVFRQFGSPDQQARVIQASIDRKAALAARATAQGTKPLAASLQKEEDRDLQTIDSYTSQQEALQPSILNLTPDSTGVRKLELGPVKNAKYMAQNLAGNSTPESRAYEALKSAVDTAVNLQVSAEKGVQTDKDVLRFAQALIAAYGRNDTEATLEALKRYNDSIERAKTKTATRIESRRKQQNVEPYFVGQIQSSTVGLQPAPAAVTAPQGQQPAPKVVDFNSLPTQSKK
jgi:hypothetical protein